ncbi:MAG: LysR family transcriptional regulator [Deferribacterales bacterium]
MDIHQFRVFIVVFKEKSVSKAAEKLYLSQPTVTEHIRNLEKQFGEKLFFRNGKHLEPTSFAKEIYPKIADLLTQYEKTVASISKKDRSIKKLSLASSSVPTIAIIPQAVSIFRNDYNTAEFDFFSTDSVTVSKVVLAHNYPIGFLGTKIENTHLAYEHIADDELVIVAKQSFFDKKILTFDDLLKRDMVVREEGSGTRKELENAFKKHNVSLNQFKISITVNEPWLFFTLIKSGNFYGFSSRHLAEINDLSIFRIEGCSIQRSIYAVYRKDITLANEYRYFLDICKKILPPTK